MSTAPTKKDTPITQVYTISSIVIRATNPISKFRVAVTPSTTILDVKVYIESLKGIAPDRQQLRIDGKILSDFLTMEHYNIKQDSDIDLVTRT
jgi:hypothetical protein